MKNRVFITILLIILVMSLTVISAGAQSSEYTIIDLGALGGSVSTVFDINEHGQVVGYSFKSSDEQHAVLWER